MAFQNIGPDDVETFTLETNPSRTYISSSILGVTGNVNVYARHSLRVKEIQPLSIFSQSFYSDLDLSAAIKTVQQAIASGSTNVFDLVGTYLTDVTNQTPSARLQQQQEIIRFVPPVDFEKDTQRKSIVINNLMKFYRPISPEAHFAFVNYHSLNFFTASTIAPGNVLLYPDTTGTSYVLQDSFTFDFWINPRYTTDIPNAGSGSSLTTSSFSPGTLLHLSGNYAVSLVTGSNMDINGYPNGFRLLLQVGDGATISPDLAISNNLPSAGNVFISDDNSLYLNYWHHVTIRWQLNAYNNTGSFVVDGVTRGTFNVTSSINDNTPGSVLCVGNFYEGTNFSTNNQALFFSTPNSQRDGVAELIDDPSSDPDSYLFQHPLNAEVHDIKIYDRYLHDDEIAFLRTSAPTGSLLGTTLSGSGNLLFYLPPFFTRESPVRTFVSDHGGVLTTPFETMDGTTLHPFNLALSFGIGGHYLNLENFTRDFATGQYPRLIGLTSSLINDETSIPLSANEFLYGFASGSYSPSSNIARSLMILPNDNGQFLPNFAILSQSNLDLSLFIDDTKVYTPGYVSLRDYLPTSSVGSGLQSYSGSIAGTIGGSSPENVSASLGSDYTIFMRTQDNTSNQVVFYDISNLFYGNKILESSFSVIDPAITGSDGKVKLTLLDDGNGNIYRGDCVTSQSSWNSVGNIFYNEGLAVLKHPSLYFFGTDQWTMNFRGSQNIHVFTVNCFKRPLQVVSSSNPSWLPVSASDNANDTDQRFVFITGINLHDEDLNVVAKTAFAQPVLARTSDKFLFKVRLDY